MNIQNTRDLRCAYELLMIYGELEPKDAVAEERLHDHVCNLKREIRAFAHRPADETRIVSDNGMDGHLILFPLPEFLESKEEAEELFMRDYYLECRPSMYDCTGQAFTSWHKIVERRGRFWAYHSVCYDF